MKPQILGRFTEDATGHLEVSVDNVWHTVCVPCQTQDGSLSFRSLSMNEARLLKEFISAEMFSFIFIQIDAWLGAFVAAWSQTTVCMCTLLHYQLRDCLNSIHLSAHLITLDHPC